MPLQISTAKPIQVKPFEVVKPKAKESDWRKAKEIADYLCVSLATVSKWTTREFDPLPHRRLAGVLQYDFEKVKEWEVRNSL